MSYFDATRFIIDSAVNKVLRDMKRDPDRSLRNFVDMGESFSRGRFQKSFIKIIQEALEKPDSPYYQLANFTVQHVSDANIRAFGVNMGYYGFTKGAKTIRKNEAAYGVNIPWTICFHLEEGEDTITSHDVDGVIKQGKTLGIHTYILFSQTRMAHELAKLIRKHDDCSFVLLVSPEGPETAWMDPLQTCDNLMTVLDASSEHYARCAAHLLQAGRLFASYIQCTPDTIDAILDGAWVQPLAQTHCVFCFLLPPAEGDDEIQKAISGYVSRMRAEQWASMIPIDFLGDILAIDQVISDEPCYLSVDATGKLFKQGPVQLPDEDIRQVPLRDIIFRNMPKLTTQQG